ncbi:uncharacterized protein LOC127842691 [Dreissena polymorpha]|uniref:Peptidase C14 caspase domain-containing protein n=1 Tax=Dreissena polymorpha TaxID=45954 RepID=A0A9D4EKR7_DREPO|nr:uncharacterized protein LOC127842691 [Dreissena polymorpha]XP_052228297.1 uncharacterized protein LOC127842691 [Dreissena polymorpha]XP_052228298.1 uncharacterized protein LOC127842691 [Dreissena polymorpha]XP_052228299.1 uncharacterized protein LOC127842691 [Dreissena polymorpha]XP_052228300.1 uncharacterized protein LOC127842691 [Dreissena polymorpha]XP_052228301.1 uncharacterized protein LOC127842691 [Dreissena polymorpha]XP_052228302.1 uncharacterized protein LOC127842691 [Dreissena po
MEEPKDEFKIFTDGEFSSPIYRTKAKRVQVVYFCLDSPIGTYNHAKQRIRVDIKASQLYGKEVDIDVFRFDRFYRDRFYDKIKVDEKDKPQMKVEIFKNYTCEEVDEVFEVLGKNAHKFDAYFFHFFTYLQVGERGKAVNRHLKDYRLQFYDRAIPLDHIFDKIKACPSMALKPKIFFVQADNLEMLQPLVIKKATPVTSERKIPSDADILVIMSTIPQELASRPRRQRTETNRPVDQPSEDSAARTGAETRLKQCSILVQAIVDILEDHVFRDEDIFTNTPLILGKAKEIIDTTVFGDDYKDYDIPVPTVRSTLTKFFFF